MGTRWKKGWRDHRILFSIACIFISAVLAEAAYAGVPLRELARILNFIVMSVMIGFFVLTFTYFLTFCYFFRHATDSKGLVAKWGDAVQKLDIAARRYLDGERWSYACFAFLALLPNDFFFIVKSLVPVVNPYPAMRWDFTFIRWEKYIHFGHLPNQLLTPLVNTLGLAHILDIVYAFWLVVMFVFVGYNTFVDRQVHRRLQFLWVFLLSWIFLGSLLATYLSSVGPMFFHDFYPEAADVYAPVRKNLDSLGGQSFFFMTKTRDLLLGWARNGEFFNPNRIAAMPSMHIAMAWLWVLYSWRINKVLSAFMAVFCFLVFLAIVYFGIHYALDAYLSLIVVSAMWWAVGRHLDRTHFRHEVLDENPA